MDFFSSSTLSIGNYFFIVFQILHVFVCFFFRKLELSSVYRRVPWREEASWNGLNYSLWMGTDHLHCISTNKTPFRTKTSGLNSEVVLIARYCFEYWGVLIAELLYYHSVRLQLWLYTLSEFEYTNADVVKFRQSDGFVCLWEEFYFIHCHRLNEPVGYIKSWEHLIYLGN